MGASVAWTVVGVCAMVVVKMVFHFFLFTVIPLSLGGLRGLLYLLVGGSHAVGCLAASACCGGVLWLG